MPTSFNAQIKPLFTPKDLKCMSAFGVLLDDFAYMSDPSADAEFSDHANARQVYSRLTGAKKPQMPKNGPYWNDSQLKLFKQWMDDGFSP
jgi:hypothetical protein